MEEPQTMRPSGAPARTRIWPHLVALAIIAATLVVGLVIYPTAPDPMPVHFDARLQPDAWESKSLGGFLLPVIIGAAVVVVFWIAAVGLPRTGTTRPAADGGPSTTAQAPRVQLSPRPAATAATMQATMRLLGDLTIATAVLIAVTALTTWVGVPEWMAPWLLPVLMTTFFGSLALSCVRVFRAQRGPG